jgi:hypothetical protein
LLASLCLIGCGTRRLEPLEAAATASAVPLDPLTQGLVAYWKLDERSPTDIASDSADGLHPATPVNAPGPALGADNPDGVVGRAFDGQSQYLLIHNADDLNFSGAITLAAWVKINALNDDCQYIIGHGYCLSPPGEVVLRVGSDTCGPVSSSPDWAGGAWLDDSYSATIPFDQTNDLGVWLHLAATYDGVAWRLYRNAVQLGLLESVVGAVPVASDWAIGARAPGVSPCVPVPPERYLNGAIAEVRIYRRALSASEVEELYHR